MRRRIPDTRGMNSADVRRIIAFLDGFWFTTEQYWAVYPDWSRGEALERDYWNRNSGLGGTYTMRAIMWYRFVYKPGGATYRPSVILDALCLATTPAPPASPVPQP